MARIALAGFIHETNTFSPIPTTIESFIFPGSPVTNFLTGEQMLQFKGLLLNNASCGFLNRAEKLGNDVVPLVRAATEPANQMSTDTFQKILGLITKNLSENGPFDGVFLDLHGAMVFEGFQEGEAEILKQVREITGNLPLVVSVDFHGNISQEFFDLASVIVGYRTYPHMDIYDTGERCADLMQYLIEGNTIFKSLKKVPFLWPLSTQSTFSEPCKSIYSAIFEEEEKRGVFSATVLAGFPPADMEQTGPAVLTYGSTQMAADQAADRLLGLIMEKEKMFVPDLLEPDLAVQKAISSTAHQQKPVILADVQDNPGGGATSDTIWVLESLICFNAPESALGLIYDPQAALAAFEAGEGAVIELDLGGKLVPGHKPCHANYKVQKVYDGEFVLNGSIFKGHKANLGKMAHLQINNIHIIVSSVRTQANDPTYFQLLGIDPLQMKILVLKSSNHFRADFDQLTDLIIQVNAPGGIIEDPSKASYKNLRDGIRLFGNGPVHKKNNQEQET